MRLYTLLISIVLCCQLANAQNYTLRGKVIDKANGSSLVGANISISDLHIKIQTQTGSNGEYLTPGLPQGTYTIKISHIGYLVIEDTLLLNKNILNNDYNLIPKESEIPEIVVTGTGTEHYLKDVPVQTEVISGKALREYSGRSIEDVLGGLSSSLTFSQNDMGSNIQLNGLKNDYILILLDGKRINGDVGGQNDLNRINMNNIERIEIVKGAVSALYGSDAIGGVINFISKKEKDKFSISNTTRVGEYGDVNQGNNINWKHGKLSSETAFSLKHTDGWRNTRQEWHRGKLIENSVTKTINRSTNYSVFQNLSYNINRNLELNGRASFYEKWTHRPMGEPLWRANGFYYRGQNYMLESRYKLGARNVITMDASFDKSDYYNDYVGREYTDYFDENGDRIVYYPNDKIMQSSQRRWMVNVKGIFYVGKAHILNIGIEDIYEKLVSPYRLEKDKASTFSISRYAQDEWNLTDRINITGGIRLVTQKEFGYSITPKISAMYKFDHFNIRAIYSNGYKAPTVKELYYHYYATLMSIFKAYYGNTDLKPQKSNYYAANLEYIKPKLNVSMTVYHNQIKEMISLQHIETSYKDKLLLVEETMKYVNLAKAYTYGFDITLDAHLPYNLKLGGGYSCLYAKAQRTDDEESDDYMKYVNINGTSRNNVSVKASWSNSWKKYKLGISINGRYQSKRYYTSDGNTKAYQIWRLNTSHSLLNKKNIQFDMSIGVDNIFNYIDRTPFGHNRGTNSPGRNYYTSVIIKFQNKK